MDKLFDKDKQDLIKSMLQNRIAHGDLTKLREAVTAEDLSQIIQHIYDLNEGYIMKLSRVEGALNFLNHMKNESRQRVFFKKINKGFRRQSPNNKVILAEGDSWFNYPLILTDLIDRIGMEKNFALYSIASGGDWLLNMLSAREYVEELSVIHPDVFLISGGGNDLVGSRRLAAIVDPVGSSNELLENKWASYLVDVARKHPKRQHYTKLNEDDFTEGCKFLNKDFFALLMFFHLQYYFLIGNILGKEGKPRKFDPIRIVTQGYDYAVPSLKKGFGLNPMKWYVPIIRYLGHGGWMKTPLLMRGVPDDKDQHRKIIYAMIYLFNEMMIELPTLLAGKPVYHIDSRGLMEEGDWADELHAKPYKAIQIGETFIKCINKGDPTYDNIYVVKS